MKRFLALVLACLMVVLCFAGCTKTPEKTEETTYTTFENGVTKIATDVYTVTIEDEYDVHSMDEYLKGKYFNDAYAQYYIDMMNGSGAACSGARNGQFVGRTYDWYYIDSPSVVVKTTGTDDRLASLAVFSGSYSAEQLENDEVSIVYSLIANDGINEAGVAIQTNVCQMGDEVTTGTNPDGPDTLALVVPRIVLDNAKSVDEAIELIKSLNIYSSYCETICEEFHWLISDSEKSVVVELVDNEVVVTESNVITNFYVNDQYFDGTVESLKENEPTAMGWRRYFLLKDGLEDVNSIESMFNHMSKVFYAKAYDADIEDYWYDEGYGYWDLDGDGTYETYFDMLTESDDNENCINYRDYFCNTLGHMTELDNGSWFTAHVSIFDLENKTLSLVVDEQDFDTQTTFEFDF